MGIYGKEKIITKKSTRSYERYSVIRDTLGYTDYQVAILSGVPPVTIYDWRNGLTTPKADRLKNICQLLGVHIEDIVDFYERKEKA